MTGVCGSEWSTQPMTSTLIAPIYDSVGRLRGGVLSVDETWNAAAYLRPTTSPRGRNVSPDRPRRGRPRGARLPALLR